MSPYTLRSYYFFIYLQLSAGAQADKQLQLSCERPVPLPEPHLMIMKCMINYIANIAWKNTVCMHIHKSKAGNKNFPAVWLSISTLTNMHTQPSRKPPPFYGGTTTFPFFPLSYASNICQLEIFYLFTSSFVSPSIKKKNAR